MRTEITIPRHGVPRLIDTPPGYAGFDQDGEVHVSVKEERLAFELTPAAPKVVKQKKKPAAKAASKKPEASAGESADGSDTD